METKYVLLLLIILKEAVDYCNNHSDICDRFSYNETTKVVNIVDLKGNIQKNNNSSLFTRQVGNYLQ